MLSRRTMLKSAGSGFAYLAFQALAHEQAANASGNENPLAPRRTHFRARARRVIFLCMEGGPSHVDTFDYKPRLTADSGRPAPNGRGGFRRGSLLGSPFRFGQHGDSGIWMSELFPELSNHADKLCMLNGMYTDRPNHAQAFIQMHCGIFQFPRPSMGAWVLYGLGTENQNLPGFISINPARQNGGAANYAASFLPAVYQGTPMGRSGFGSTESISNLSNRRRSLSAQRTQIDYIQELNRGTAESLGDSSAVEGLISSYELAFRMQSEMPGVLDLSRENANTLRLYGIEENRNQPRPRFGGGGGMMRNNGGSSTFGRQCLLARRLIESGVRFVEVTMGGWDHHRNLRESLTNNCQAIDKPIAGLLTDLQQRGLLQDTLVLWGGEFGRTPYAQGDGRDHNNNGYTMWMAGGGAKGGFTYGRTDEYGFEAVENRMHVHDWHATILHLLGLDHERLTFRYAGRDMRLTDVHGTVANQVIN